MNAIEQRWLQGQATEIRDLATRSEILDVTQLDERTHVLRYDALGLVAMPEGTVVEHRGFFVCCYFHENYHRRVLPALVLTLIEPGGCFSPHVSAPLICIGTILPGTPLVEIARRVFEVLTLQNVGASERDAMNAAACRWVRANFERLPIDPRPLEWRAARHAPVETAE